MGNVTLAWSKLFSLGAQVQTAADFRGRVKVNGRNSVRESAILISTQFNYYFAALFVHDPKSNQRVL